MDSVALGFCFNWHALSFWRNLTPCLQAATLLWRDHLSVLSSWKSPQASPSRWTCPKPPLCLRYFPLPHPSPHKEHLILTSASFLWVEAAIRGLFELELSPEVAPWAHGRCSINVWGVTEWASGVPGSRKGVVLWLGPTAEARARGQMEWWQVPDLSARQGCTRTPSTGSASGGTHIHSNLQVEQAVTANL